MIGRFPKEGYGFYRHSQWGLSFTADIVALVLCLVIATWIFVLLLRRLRAGGRVRRQSPLILLLYFLISVAFGFAYHAMFQKDPRHFKLNAPTADLEMFAAIEEHQRNLDVLRDSKQINALTLQALRSPKGRQLLTRLARSISGDVRSVYMASLSLLVVGPTDPLTREEAEAIGLVSGDTDAEVLRAHKAALANPQMSHSRSVFRAIGRMPAGDARNMNAFLRDALRVTRPPGRSLEVFATAEDSARLHEFLTSVLQLTFGPHEKVDIPASLDGVAVVEIGHRAAIGVGTQKWERLVDFLYFSLITISTVGYGDVLPNSPYARAAVSGEILLGILILVFLVNEAYAGGQVARAKGNKRRRAY